MASPEPGRNGEALADGMPMCETTILDGGPAGTGPPVWAARYALLGAWLDRGVAIVEQRRWLGGPPGRWPLNADSWAVLSWNVSTARKGRCSPGRSCDAGVGAPAQRAGAAWAGRPFLAASRRCSP